MALITNRRPPARQPGLFLIQVRSHAARNMPLRPKLVIPIDIQEPTDIPHAVEITHLNGNGSSSSSQNGH